MSENSDESVNAYLFKTSEDSNSYLIYFKGTGKAANLNRAFENFKNYIDYAIFEDGITSIGDNLLNGYNFLSKIMLPESLTSIGEYAFSSSSLLSITIPSAVTNISDYAFCDCYKLVEIYNLSSLNISVGSTEIGSLGHYAKVIHNSKDEKSILVESNGCVYYELNNEKICLGLINKNDTELNIDNDCTSIYQYAFYKCENLGRVVIPSSVTAIENFAFFRSGLNDVIISESVTSIGNFAFSCCTKLNSVIIPKNVTSIGLGIFSDCKNLVSLTLPFIGANASSKTTLESLFGTSSYSYDVPQTLKEVIIEEGCTNIPAKAFAYCSYVSNITIPSSVTSIAESAFESCQSLLNITIPSNVTSVGTNAFKSCKRLLEVYNLSSLNIEAGLTNYGYVGYYAKIIHTSKQEKSNYIESNNLVYFVLNDEKICISPISKNITEVSFDSDCTSIYDSAFSSCSNLTRIVISNNITNIGANAFDSCESLSNVTLGSGLKFIDSKAFYNCYSLNNIYYNGNIEKWLNINWADDYSNPLYYAYHIYIINESGEYELGTYAEIPNTITSLGEYAFYAWNDLNCVILPESITSIENNAFSACYRLAEIYNLSSLNITKGSEEYGGIGYYAEVIHTSREEESNLINNNGVEYILIYGEKICIGLLDVDAKTVTLDDDCTSINYFAFYNYKNLTSIKLSDSIAKIGNAAFYNCESLTSIVIPNNVTYLGSYAFYNCTNLTSIIIGTGVTQIRNKCFAGCTNLTTLLIQKDINLINEAAFDSCTKLTKIYFTGDENDWANITIVAPESHNRDLYQDIEIYFYSESYKYGNYWHYDSDNNIVEW